ncbi:hypothetical protein DM01DRAFT_1337522 [Hesseltinella vesiculosa]|uniref:Uncharacterized protein n=1 Tax=Hesseltinella vesiculosa TaxID=101127 RepID=A0A1X2GE27_9FUNG|nr:hypothetical protein DM01DRAFT_1337522 [Hesseltinella vesiculosa]
MMREDNIYRTSRSERDWSVAQLSDYNIGIVNVDAATFFGRAIETVALDEVPESVLTCLTSDDIADDEDPGYDLLRFHDIVMNGGLENTVNNLVEELLRMLKFRGQRRIILTCQRLPLTMCGTSTTAETDVCVQNNDNILLLVQEDKAYRNSNDPEPQLVAEAIAAFQHNNRTRQRHLRKEPLLTYTFPCVAMVGSHARFYKIPVTQSLNEGVINGYKPLLETKVQCFDPLENNPMSGLGMAQLDSRKKIMQSFKLMKSIMLEQAELLL